MKGKKKEPLTVGQRVFIEVLGGWGIHKERNITEYEIVEANNTSAYAVQISKLTEYHSDIKKFSYLKTRIILKTHEIKDYGMLGFSERLWLTKESFERNVQYHKELKELRTKAVHLINQMNADELRKVLEI